MWFCLLTPQPPGKSLISWASFVFQTGKKKKCVCGKSYNYWIWFSFELFLSDMTARFFGRWQAPRLQSVCAIKNMLLGCVCVCVCMRRAGECLCMYMCVCTSWLVLDFQSCPALCNPMDCSLPGSSLHGILQEKLLELGSHSLIQGIFPTQGSNPGLLHCRQILYYLSYREALWMSVWRKVAHMFVHIWVSMWIACMWVNVLRIYVCMCCVCKRECMRVYGLPRRLRGKESACDAGDAGSIPVLGRSPGGGNGNASQADSDPCLT